MKHKFLYLTLILLSPMLLAQQFTLGDLFSFAYYPQSIEGGTSMKDGEHYTLLSKNGIDKFSYKTFEKVGNIKTGQFSDYFFNADESWLVLESESEPIYRHSKRAIYTLHNMKTGNESVIFEGKKVQEPTLSPDGKKVAFVFENNIYFQEIATGKVTQITTDGKKNHIINGVTDWVYEEEFAFVRAFDWNAASNQIAFIRFDESEVPEMDIDIYGTELYPDNLTFKYPKAGEKNADVSVHIYDLNQKNIQNLDLSAYNDFYVPRIQFSKKANELAVLVSNRHQNQVDVWMVNSNDLGKKNFLPKLTKRG